MTPDPEGDVASTDLLEDAVLAVDQAGDVDGDLALGRPPEPSRVVAEREQHGLGGGGALHLGVDGDEEVADGRVRVNLVTSTAGGHGVVVDHVGSPMVGADLAV